MSARGRLERPVVVVPTRHAPALVAGKGDRLVGRTGPMLYCSLRSWILDLLDAHLLKRAYPTCRVISTISIPVRSRCAGGPR